jgi:hypothetical protein
MHARHIIKEPNKYIGVYTVYSEMEVILRRKYARTSMQKTAVAEEYFGSVEEEALAVRE